MSLFRLSAIRARAGRQGYENSPVKALVEGLRRELHKSQAQVATLTQERDDLQEQVAAAPTSAARATRLMAEMPDRECERCHGFYRPFPAFWPGGFHGEPGICAYCKPESAYE